jgi:hypothetical protein
MVVMGGIMAVTTEVTVVITVVIMEAITAVTAVIMEATAVIITVGIAVIMVVTMRIVTMAITVIIAVTGTTDVTGPMASAPVGAGRLTAMCGFAGTERSAEEAIFSNLFHHFHTQLREKVMGRGLIAAGTAIMVMLAAGILWNANASPMGVPSLPNYSPVQTVGCSGPGRCGWGRHWVCGPYGRCGCVACGYVAPRGYVAPHVYVGPRPYYRRRSYYY